MRPARPALIGAALSLALVAGGCASSSGSDAKASASAASAASAASRTALDKVLIKGTAAAPTLDLPSKPLTVSETTTKLVTRGTGAMLTDKLALTVNYLIVNGKDGKQIESSFGKAKAGLDLADGKLLPGLRKGLLGQQVGSRVLVAVPPKEAFGDAGNSQIGVGATDTVLFLVDIVTATTPLTSAQGDPVAPKAGLPTVVPGKDPKTPAKITVPKADPPKALVVQPLVNGKGAKVVAGQTLRVAYTGVIWKDGRQFDSSATTANGWAQFPIGVGQVIKGWDKALVGRPVGSRLLLVVPPGDGYGSAGQPNAGITGTDTLVFVVDLLAAS
ncbi:MAG TPA: FKBP-type peptidyl-prolyl cis-trans isomerase [Dermatophilaceae bacterium]|nr:FKBP-type peptidyl-prolyl cis-trans isomerase [Dermatophilaceae bacterium]